MNLRQAAQQALEALEWGSGTYDRRNAAITALKQALAEPEQGPISLNEGRLTQYSDGSIGFGTLEIVGAIGHAPVPRKPQTTHWEGCEAVHPECRKPDTDCHAQGICQRSGYSIAPTPRKPLKEDEIADLWDGHTVPVFGKTGINPIVFARAIERAHGIGEGQ